MIGGISSTACVGDKLPDWNTKAQLQALQRLAATLPDPAAQPVKREPTPVPRTAKQIKGDQAQALITAYEAEATLAQLSSDFGISKQTVSLILKRHGIEPRWSRWIKDEEVDQAVRLYEQGQSLAQIGNRLNFNAATIHKHLKRRGVRMRDNHGRD